MLKRLFWILCLLPIMAVSSAFAVDCANNEFKYIDANNNETCIENKFQITTTNDTDKFVFNMSAKGTFYIDWGDGNVQMLDRSSTTAMTEYTHNYASANEYIIKFGGLATGYSTTATSGEIPYGISIIFGTSSITTNNTSNNLAAISGSLGAIFPTIDNGGTYAKQPRFYKTFNACSRLTSTIPSTLFAGVRGVPVIDMFTQVFASAGLTGSIPEDLFGRVVNGVYDGIDGNVTSRLFNNLFAGCTGLTGAIPENLFGRVVNGVYYGAKYGNDIAQVFYKTFKNCTGLTGTNIDDPNNPGKKYALPPELFAKNINGTYYGITSMGSNMFFETFLGCTGLNGTIPGKLFSGISHAPTSYMFYATFSGCTGLTGSIPGTLFGRYVNGTYYGVKGSPAVYMFQNTFYGCSGLTGSIPENLFAGISGKPATQMFFGTFYHCSNLTGAIPSGLFSGLSGSSASNMFRSTFNGCTNLGKDTIGGESKYFIPDTLFANIDSSNFSSFSDSPTYGMFANTGLLVACPDDYYKVLTGFESGWGGSKVACSACPNGTHSLPGSTDVNQCLSSAQVCNANEFLYNGSCVESKFEIETTSDTDFFVFNMSASGVFFIDWGDGNVQALLRSDTAMTEYSHNYNTQGKYTIKFGGRATGYTTSTASWQYPSRATIFFGKQISGSAIGANNTYDKIGGISGSLGAIFPTLGTTPSAPDNTLRSIQPNFMYCFNNCSNLSGPIPPDLFTGLTGTPTENMFIRLFQNCSGLTGAIPANLFAGLSGQPSERMFYYTFSGCSHLSGTNIDAPNNQKYAIPPTLFSNLSGVPKISLFSYTFQGCSGLTGVIPETLFHSVSGTSAGYLFAGVFSGCKGLTGSIPENLFANISGSISSTDYSAVFNGCSGLTGSIPENLFGRVINGVYTGIDGGAINNAFASTFDGCKGLTGSIPENLFGRVMNGTYHGINGNIGTFSFSRTFYGCTGLTGTIPENLFGQYVNGTWYGVKGTPQQSSFANTFYGCTGLTGPIPEHLFGEVSGPVAINTFAYTFGGCTNIGRDTVGGPSKYFIPPALFANITASSASGSFTQIFYHSGLLASCPNDYYKYITGFESNFNGHVSCSACPVAYPDSASGATAITQCYADINYYDSDKTTLLNNSKIYYDSNNVSGFSFPSYTPVKPDSAFVEWDSASGTTIDTTGTFSGNQSFYAKWRFNCDSGHYFHAGNEQICTAETKRTTHALVIKPDANHTYYIHATPNSEHDYTINSSSIHKMKVNYNGTIYNLHDASVYFSE